MAKTKTPDKPETDAQRRLAAFAKLTAKPKTALDSFETPAPDDKRWATAKTCRNAYYIVECKEGLLVYEKLDGTKGATAFETWRIHVMDSVKMKPTTFRASRHQGYIRYKTSMGVLRLKTSRLNLLAPEGQPCPEKQPGGQTPHMGEREALILDLAGVLGCTRDEASEHLYAWTGR